MLYLNDGDWVESCTALVEHHDGRLELIDWAALNRLSFFAPRGAGGRSLPDAHLPWTRFADAACCRPATFAPRS